MSVDTIFVAVRDVDDQTPLVDSVVDVAESTGALVVLARAYEEAEYEDRVEELKFDSRPTPDEVARRSEHVRTVASALDEANVDYEIRGVVGEAGDAFVSLSEEVNPDLLYIQGQGRTPTGKALFGSTAQTVLLNAPYPVVYV